MSDEKPPAPFPRIIPGIAWNPREQCRIFDWMDLGYIPLDTTPVVLLPHNPCRAAFTIEWVSGATQIAIAIGEVPTLTDAGGASIAGRITPYQMNCHDNPGMPQNQWTAVASGPAIVRVWEMVAHY